MSDNLTAFLNSLYALITLVITGFVIPLLNSKLKESHVAHAQAVTDMAVTAAEQAFPDGPGSVKKAFVDSYVSGQGVKVDTTTADMMVESAVQRLTKPDMSDLVIGSVTQLPPVAPVVQDVSQATIGRD